LHIFAHARTHTQRKLINNLIAIPNISFHLSGFTDSP